MVNKIVIIVIAISIIVGLIIGVTAYTEKTENGTYEGDSQIPKPEPKKFIVDLEENMGIQGP